MTARRPALILSQLSRRIADSRIEGNLVCLDTRIRCIRVSKSRGNCRVGERSRVDLAFRIPSSDRTEASPLRLGSIRV